MFRRCLLGVLVLLVAGTALTDAATAKKQRNVAYYGHVKASGEWHVHWDCLMDSYDTAWQMEAVYGKSFLVPAGELDQTLGGASGRIDYRLDSLCNGNIDAGSCPISMDDAGALPVFLDKVKGGLRVDFQFALAPVGCGTHQVFPYGAGFETGNRVETEPSGVIPAKKIGRKTIVVPLSGHATGSGTGRTFNGVMSGTLTLTRKPYLLPLPF